MKYGGLSKDGEFGNIDAVTKITVRPAAKHTVDARVFYVVARRNDLETTCFYDVAG